MKLLTWHGRGLFVVPGMFTLEQGDSHEVDDHLGDTLIRANPSEPLTLDRLPPAGRSKKQESPSGDEPEADDGEGPSHPNEEKE